MRVFQACALWLLLGNPAVVAFSNIAADPALEGLVAAAGVRRQNPSATPPFDEKAQYVSTEGLHKFKPPGALDQRGPCPGLNALANHAYLPRIGIATIPQFVLATTTVFGMGQDLANILAVYGSVIDGVGAGWSIAGIPHTGIGGSHNNYETDNSPGRGDLNQYGSNTKLIMSQFQRLYDLQPNAATANYDIDVLRQFRGIRFKESIAKNPYFFYAPFSGAIVSQAAYSFIFRFMANKSEEHPTGLLDKDVLKSFFSVQGPEKNLKWVPGHERIPNNWYTRNKQDAYNINYFSDDINYFAEAHPEVTIPGCNQGKVNSFQKINVTSSAGEKIDPAEIRKSPLCYGLSFALVQSGLILGVVSNALQEVVLPAQNALNCPTIPDLDSTVGKSCPGYSLFGGPKGKVVKGAIQN